MQKEHLSLPSFHLLDGVGIKRGELLRYLTHLQREIEQIFERAKNPGEQAVGHLRGSGGTRLVLVFIRGSQGLLSASPADPL